MNIRRGGTAKPRQNCRGEGFLGFLGPSDEIPRILVCGRGPETGRGKSAGSWRRPETTLGGCHRGGIEGEFPGASDPPREGRELRCDVVLVDGAIVSGDRIQRGLRLFREGEGNLVLEGAQAVEDFVGFGLVEGFGGPCQKLFLPLVLEFPSLINILLEPDQPTFHLLVREVVGVRRCLGGDVFDFLKGSLQRGFPRGDRFIQTRFGQVKKSCRQEQHEPGEDPERVLCRNAQVLLEVFHVAFLMFVFCERVGSGGVGWVARRKGSG